MIKNYFRNRKEANNKVCQVGGLNIEFIQQPLEKSSGNYVKPTLNIYGFCTEAEKKKMQESDIFNVNFCPPLTEEQKTMVKRWILEGASEQPAAEAADPNAPPKPKAKKELVVGSVEKKVSLLEMLSKKRD